MTAEQWADRVFADVMLPPGQSDASITRSSINRAELTKLIEKAQRESWEAALASVQPMPGAELSMKQIDEMSEFVERIASAYKNRTSIDVMAWEQLPQMFRRMRNYALFLQGPLSDIVNDNSAHYDNWARIRQESYNEALADALKAIEDAESETESSLPYLRSNRLEILLEKIPDILMGLIRKQTEPTPTDLIRSYNQGLSAAITKIRDEANRWNRDRSNIDPQNILELAEEIASLLKKESSNE